MQNVKLSGTVIGAEEISQLQKAVDDHKASLAERFRELAVLTRLLAKRDEEFKRQQSQMKQLEACLAELRSELSRDRQQHNYTVRVYEAHLSNLRGSLSWRAMAPVRALVSMVGGERVRVRRMLEQSNLFDREWYLKNYPDVAEARLDPLEHYLSHGANEGRDPSPVFSTRGYLLKNPDVLHAGINPLVHYLLHGCFEGRG